MTTNLSPPSADTDTDTNPDAAPSAEATCEMCPHDLDHHDRISLRFCAATAAGAMTRSCICPAA